MSMVTSKGGLLSPTALPKEKKTKGNQITAIINARMPPPIRYLIIGGFLSPRGWGYSSSTFLLHYNERKFVCLYH